MLNQSTAIILFAVLSLALLAAFSGCAYYTDQMSAERMQNGYTMVLPGIEGPDRFNSNIAQGLENGGVRTAIEVHDWTTGRAWNFLTHLQDIERNRQQARILARRIIEYQDQYPGRPVHLVGHSGGAGLILLTLEALPADRRISSVILLAPAVLPRFDLTTALTTTDSGIWNFHSLGDVPLLIIGTSLAGTIDRQFSFGSGAVGFKLPKAASDETRRLYEAKLHQIPFRFRMISRGNLGGHFGWTTKAFARDYLAPIIRENSEYTHSGHKLRF